MIVSKIFRMTLDWVFGGPIRLLFFSFLCLSFSWFYEILEVYLSEGDIVTGSSAGSFNLYSHLPEAFRDVGIAFFVASVIYISVEQRASFERNNIFEDFGRRANKLLSQVSSTTLDGYFQKTLPDGWFDYVKGEIEKANFIRTDVEVDITISTPESGEVVKSVPYDYVYVDVSVSYTVRNMTDSEGTYSIESFVEFPFADELRHISNMTEITINGKPLNLTELTTADHNWSDSDTHKQIKHEIDIP